MAFLANFKADEFERKITGIIDLNRGFDLRVFDWTKQAKVQKTEQLTVTPTVEEPNLSCSMSGSLQDNV